MQRHPKLQIVHSSVTYQVILYFNVVYAFVMLVGELILYIYKGENLLYNGTQLAGEVVLTFAWGIVEAIRLYLGMRGNLTESILTVLASLLLTIPCAVYGVWILIWQTYALRLEIITVVIMFVFYVIETILGFISIGVFVRAN